MHWRKSTWALIVWTALMLVWLVASATATATNCLATGGVPGDCNVYAGLAGAVIGVIWLAGALPLSVIWYATQARVATGATTWGPRKEHPRG